MATHIYHGFWINWTQGAIRGATITIGERSGGLLTSFIATFVTLVSTQFWRILCFALHQIRTNKGPQDGLHHQQQVVFRNTATPGGAAWTFMQQCWHWRNKARLAFLRTFPWALFSLGYLLLFALAAVFSSDISKSSGNTRLIIGNQCGLWTLNTSNPNAQAAFSAKITNDSLVAASYARACYGNSYDPLQCGRYTTSSLKWTANQNASCPFESGVCYYGDTAAYSMTTHRLDSHHDFGINTPERYRVEFVKSTTCAPVHTGNFYQVKNLTTPDDTDYGQIGDTVVFYDYGGSQDANGVLYANWTYYYNLHAPLDVIGYTVGSSMAVAGNGGWIPIPALNQTAGDMSMVFIAPNSIRTSQPCDDPVFGSHYFVNASASDPDIPSFYTTDRYVNPITCVEQYMICNPTNDICTPPLGSGQLLPYLLYNPTHLSLNNMQLAISERIISGALFTSVYHQTVTRSGAALRAQDTVNDLDQFPLPKNQWMIEVGSWFDTALARLQRHVQEFATGPATVVDGAYVWLADNALQELMCYTQMVNDSTDTMSFSVLGLVILFAFGGLIMITSLFIERIVAWAQKRLGTGLHARTAWLVDDKLQLQRLLFQETGQGFWSKSPEDPIPVTETKDEFIGIGAIQAGARGGYGAVSGKDDGKGSPTSEIYSPTQMEKNAGVYVYDRQMM